MKLTKTSLYGVTAAMALTAVAAAPAYATHGRGAAIVPSVDASGVLTLDMKSFWRRQGSLPACSFPHDCISGQVTGPGGFSQSFDRFDTGSVETVDLSDTRRAEVEQTNTLQLTTAGLYTISWNSGNWQAGVDNLSGNDYGTQSTIFWDGSTANAPIIFDLENIQQEVVRGNAYSDNLDAVAGSGLSLTYGATTSGLTDVDQTYGGLPGYSIDSNGNVQITAAGTASIQDNGTTGADVAFDGKITASDGSSVEFYWVFDGVAQGANQTPDVADLVIDVVVGDPVNQIITATDPNGDSVALSLTSFSGIGGSFVDNGDNSGTFTWDTTGVALGQYVATILGNDGGLTDSGSLRINVIAGGSKPPVPPIPLPAASLLLGTGLLGLGGFSALRRRRKS